MSFSFEYTSASAADALKVLDREHAPYCVKEFVSQALRGLKGPVRVKAHGHLYDGQSHDHSYAHIEVQPFTFAKTE